MKIFFLSFCFGITFLLTSFAQSPSWTDAAWRARQYPKEMYITGFSVDKFTPQQGSLDDFINKLKNTARKELVESIQVKVSNETSSKVVEDKKGIQSTYQIQTQAQSQIELAQAKSEHYYDPKSQMGYAFVFVKKNDLIDYYREMTKNIQLTIDGIFAEAKVYKEERDIQKAIQTYSKTLKHIRALERYQNYLVALGENATLQKEAMNKNYVLPLKKEMLYLVKQQQIVLQGSPASLKGHYNEALTEPLKIDAQLVTFQSKNKLKGVDLPIMFMIDTMTQCNTRTNEMGKAECVVDKIKSKQKTQTAVAHLDLVKYLGIDTIDIANDMFNQLYVPAVFNLNINPLSFYIESEELDVQNKKNNIFIEPQIKNVLSGLGFIFTNQKKDADYFIDIKAQPTSDNSDKSMKEIYFVFLNTTISIVQAQNGNEVYKNSFNNVKGGSISPEKACSIAYKKTADLIKKDVDKLFQPKGTNF